MLARFKITTTAPTQIVEITKEITKIISESGVDSGICTIFCPHSTAGITLTESSDSELLLGIIQGIESLAPTAGGLTIDNRVSTHIKSILTGNSLNLIICEGRALIGNWQSVFLCEFNGSSSRTIFVKITEG